MKKHISLLFLLITLCITVSAQTHVLTFTAADTCNHHVQVDRVVIINHTKGWEETIYWPDTVLVLHIGTGIDEVTGTGNMLSLQLSQNNPNPFEGVTFAYLTVTEPGDVVMDITDVVGRNIRSVNYSLMPGVYQLCINLSTSGIYFLTAWENGQKSSVKMVNRGEGGKDAIDFVEYNETGSISEKLKNSPKSDCTRPFNPGDYMEFYCYATINGSEEESNHYTRYQSMTQESFTFRFPFGEGCQDALPCYGMPAVTDIDGNTYNTVQIGKQCWMKQNLRTTRYANGDTIFMGNNTLSLEEPYRYYPNNNAGAVNSYGYLYNWAALMHGSSSSNTNPSGVQGICPKGWHVPSDAEWQQLVDYVSSRSDYQWSCATCIAKSLAYTYGWTSFANNNVVGGNQSANNATGFSALPAGYCGYGGGQYDYANKALFWGATECNAVYTYLRILNYDDSHVTRYGNDKKYGFSVRCICDSLPQVFTSPVSSFTDESVVCGGSVVAIGNLVTSRGVCWSTSHNPTLADNHTTDGTGVGNFTSYITGMNPSTTYYIRAYATNQYGTVYGEEVSARTANVGVPCAGGSTVVDYDGNIYETVQIGSQCWMKSNLRSTHFADGTSIALGNGTSSWVTPNRYIPNNDDSLVPDYGYLYNWAAVMHGSTSSNTIPSNVQGVCPNGWHVPSDAEWNLMEGTLTNTDLNVMDVRGDHAYKLSGGFQGTWAVANGQNVPGNYWAQDRNITGFTALPAGFWNFFYGDANAAYENFHTVALLWTATEGGIHPPTTALARGIVYGSMGVDRGWRSKVDCLSVRCVRN